MYDLIEIYLKRGGRWEWQDSTRMHKTLVSAHADYAGRYQGIKIKCAYAHRA
ncbi:MAG: hypothetical protein RL535_1516 [Pseudomonadota bacterium]|jgi:hypothetical protein